MPLSEAFLADAEARLGQLSPSLPAAFRAAVAAIGDVPEEKLQLWADEAIALADDSLRSWEASGDYFQVGASVLSQLDEASFKAWAQTGRTLAELSASIASAYFRVSPAVLPHLAGSQIRDWADLGQRLYKGTWKSISLSSEFFVLSPILLESLSLAEAGRFVRVLEGISDRSADLAAACLDASPSVFSVFNHAERLAFLEFAAAIADSAWPEASLYFQRGPELLNHLDPSQRAAFLELATRVARRLGRQAYALFAEAAVALEEVDPAQHGHLIELAGGLVNLSPTAAMATLKAAPVVVSRLQGEALEQWHAAGLDILCGSSEGGEAYFRLESSKAEQVIQSLTSRVELTNVNELLRLYGKALSGTDIAVRSIASFEGKGIGWVSERGPSTEGSAVYLPEYIEEHDSKAENFAVLKVYTTHQTAHLEFGSFEFDYQQEGGVLPRRRQLVEAERQAEGTLAKQSWLTDMERFFDLFPERQIGADLFTITEDLRIDSRVHEEYGGIRRSNARVQESELVRRPDIRTLPLRQVFVENLLRASLNGEATIEWPKPLQPAMVRALQALGQVRPMAATVEDAAEAAIILYEIAMQIPNLPPALLQDLDWEEMTDELMEELEKEAASSSGSEPIEQLKELPEGDEVPYESPDLVDFRGDFKPELVQLLMRMRSQDVAEESETDLSALTPEQIKELLEKSVEVDMDLEDEFDMSSFNALLENLESDSGLETEDLPDDTPVIEAPVEPLAAGVRTFYYDEWDFRAADYKPRWCAVHQRVLEEGTEDYYEKILADNASLVAATQRHFEMLKPDTFRKIKRLEDGEDIDIDAAIEFVVSRRAGHGDVQKIYWRRNKMERDVAVAFLLDMSASTDEEIEKRRPRRDGPPDQNEPRRPDWPIGRGGLMEPPKRIIDLEKESLVLLTHALEVLGDRYGIYGFSGYGRENVEYFVIKDFDEPFGAIVRRRIDKVTPIRSTRMGPAIRHTTSKLLESDAKNRILFLVSDGRPQDHGYGRDRTEKEYAIHDTHKALVEAKHKGIVPFALTVDKEGHDYLGQMCGDMAYEVLGDIEILPSRLPTLYRRLTE